MRNVDKPVGRGTSSRRAGTRAHPDLNPAAPRGLSCFRPRRSSGNALNKRRRRFVIARDPDGMPTKSTAYDQD